jgi:hypothetical protein
VPEDRAISIQLLYVEGGEGMLEDITNLYKEELILGTVEEMVESLIISVIITGRVLAVEQEGIQEPVEMA